MVENAGLGKGRRWGAATWRGRRSDRQRWLQGVTFSRESKCEIKGSKSRSEREKNVISRNLKNAIWYGKS